MKEQLQLKFHLHLQLRRVQELYRHDLQIVDQPTTKKKHGQRHPPLLIYSYNAWLGILSNPCYSICIIFTKASYMQYLALLSYILGKLAIFMTYCQSQPQLQLQLSWGLS